MAKIETYIDCFITFWIKSIMDSFAFIFSKKNILAYIYIIVEIFLWKTSHKYFLRYDVIT